MCTRTLSIKNDGVIALFKGPGGYETDIEIAKIAGLESEKKYPVTKVYIGNWNSAVVLEGFDGYEFNTLQFDFFKDDKPIDIVEEYSSLFGY